MSLRTRILLVVLGVMPATFFLVGMGITVETLQASASARAMEAELLEKTSEIYVRDLRGRLLEYPAGTPDAVFISALGETLNAIQEEPDPWLEDFSFYWASGEWARGDEELLPDDPAARASAAEQDVPVVRGHVVWRRLQFGGDGEGRVIGVLGLRFSPEKFRTFNLERQLVLILGVTVMGTVALALLLLLILGRAVINPVERLAEGARRVAGGDYEHTIPVPSHHDELSHFVSVFNEMVANVRDARQILEARVAAATEQVRSTEKRLAVAQRLAATGRLAAEIAHEINNPVGGMINAARTLRGQLEKGESLPPGKTETYLELILDGLSRVQRTVSEVLLFARREVRTSSLQIMAPLDRALALVSHRARSRGVNLEVAVPADLPPVFGDEGELQQVFLNLLINAVDASVPGGGVRVRAWAEDETVRVAVQDDGEGMSAEVQDHAFDPFYTTKPEGEGTGIGLSIVHNIVTSHDGEIDLASAPGRGTTVTVALPVHQLGDGGGETAGSPAPTPGGWEGLRGAPGDASGGEEPQPPSTPPETERPAGQGLDVDGV